MQHLLDKANQLIELKAAFKLCYIEEKLQNTVMVDGLRLESKVLRKNLEANNR